jgi:aspartate aminotransferase-like enzyme
VSPNRDTEGLRIGKVLAAKKLFTAGPVSCFPEVLEAMKSQMYSHRSREYKTLHEELIKRLQRLLETNKTVLLFPASGTGIMEASVRNCVNRGDSILVTSIGAFGERYREVVESNGRKAVYLDFKPGEHVDPKVMKETMEKHNVKAVSITYNETSTGVLNPLPELARIVKKEDKLLFVDAVSAMGGAEIKFDEWGIDIVFSSSQKAFGVPPGLAMGAFSDRVFELSEKIQEKGWYFDLAMYKKYQEKETGTPSTPPIPQMMGLNVMLGKMEEMGKAKWLEMYRKRSGMVREGVKRIGLGLLAKEGYESPTITAIKTAEGVKGDDVYYKMRDKGFELAKGYGPVKQTTFRIGNMGYMPFETIQEMLANLEEVVRSL